MRRILCEDEQIARLANAEVSRLEKANLAGQPIWRSAGQSGQDRFGYPAQGR